MNDNTSKPKYWDIPWSITEVFVVVAVSFFGFALIGILLEILKPIGDTKRFLRIILSEIMLLSLVFYFVSYFKGKITDLGIRFDTFWKELWAGAKYFFIIVGVMIGVVLLFGSLSYILDLEIPQKSTKSIEDLPLTPLLLIAVLAVAPICEEVIWRGFIYGAFRKRMTKIISIFVNASLFGLLHLSGDAVITTFVMGLICALVYEKRRNIIAPVVVHFLWNSQVTLIKFIL